MRKKPELKIEVREEREMTEVEVETVASLLFTWWKREFENGVVNDFVGDAGKEGVKKC